MSMNLFARGLKVTPWFLAPETHTLKCVLWKSQCFLIIWISFHSPKLKMAGSNIYCSSVAVGAMSASFLRMLILYTRPHTKTSNTNKCHAHNIIYLLNVCLPPNSPHSKLDPMMYHKCLTHQCDCFFCYFTFYQVPYEI